MPRQVPRSVALLVVLIALGACRDSPPASSTADVGREQSGADAASLERAATPIDSVGSWVDDIRSGIAPLAALVGSDPEGARQRAVELYVTRQERIEQSVGPGTRGDADLAASVLEAEARFHELMQVLGATPPPDSARVAATVSALDAELARVRDRVPAGPSVVAEEAP